MTVYLQDDKVSKAAFLTKDSTQTSVFNLIWAMSAYDQYKVVSNKTQRWKAII